MNVYEQAEALLRARLVTAAGKVRRNAEACVALGIWLLRRHGPHGAGRQFWVPRLELARSWRFQEQVGLTASQIRTARNVLVEVGLLTLIEAGERREGEAKHAPNVFEIGPEFALLFPKTLSAQEEVATKTPGRPGVPLFVATCDRLPVGRPVIRKPPRPKDLHKALLEDRLQELARSPTPLPTLSRAALSSNYLLRGWR